jgi:hypothetical protein
MEGRALANQLHAAHLVRVEERHVHTAIKPRATQPGHCHVSEGEHGRQQIAGGDKLIPLPHEVGARIESALHPVDERVAARLVLENVDRTDHLALIGEDQLDGIVEAAGRVAAEIGAVRADGEHTARPAAADDIARFIADFVAVAALHEVDAPTGMQERSVDIRRVADVAEVADEQLPPVGHAIAIEVLKLPEPAGRSDVERPFVPQSPLRKCQLVDESGGPIEPAIAICVLKHRDEAGQLLFEFFALEVQPGRFGHKQPATVIEARHHRMSDERRRCSQLKGVAIRDADRGHLECSRFCGHRKTAHCQRAQDQAKAGVHSLQLTLQRDCVWRACPWSRSTPWPRRSIGTSSWPSP